MKRYQVIMSNSAGMLDQSDAVDTLSEVRGALMRMVERVYEVHDGDMFTIVDRDPDKEPVYE